MRSVRSLSLCIGITVAFAWASPGCDSDDDTIPATTTTTTGGQGGTAGGSTVGGGGQGTGGDPITDQEICDDGLDNDRDGTVDEDCSCTDDDTQLCYPAAHAPPAGCEWGEQICAAGAWGACVEPKMPPEGQDECCTVLDGDPVHELYDAFLAAYPPANMPKTLADIQAFAPVADGHAMAWSDLNVGNELIDDTNGGVIAANLEAGRAVSRAEAESSIPAGSTIVWVKEDPPIIEAGGLCDPPPNGTGAPGGVGWAWGSLVYEAPDESVGELVYLYIGFCDPGDLETFYYSDSPVIICQPPVIPR